MGDVKWSDVRKIAAAEIGYEEGPNNWNKFAAFLDNLPGGPYFNFKKQNVAWCAVFTSYCIYKASSPDPRGTAYAAQYQPRRHVDNCGAGCTYNAQYYRNAGKFYNNPEPGDVFFVGTKGHETHTGFVDKVNGDGTFTTIEGNCGNGVRTRTRHVRDMSGFGRPWYTLEDTPTPEPKPVEKPEAPKLPPKRAYFKIGDKGENVKQLQRCLCWLFGDDCMAPYGVDGSYGKLTAKCVTRFEKMFNGEIDIEDPGLWGKQCNSKYKSYSKETS